MRSLVLLLFLLAFFTSSALSWGSKGKKEGDCPYMQQKYREGANHERSGACPLKDKCPLYAAVVQGEPDISIDSLKTADVNWSQAAQSSILPLCN
jgi:hypothetical protein